MLFSLLGSEHTEEMLFSDAYLFFSLGMGETVRCLTHYHTLEVESLLSFHIFTTGGCSCLNGSRFDSNMRFWTYNVECRMVMK